MITHEEFLYTNQQIWKQITRYRQMQKYVWDILQKLPTVVSNGPLVHPDTSSTPHISSSIQSSTVVRSGPSTWLCHEPTGSTRTVTRPTTVTCFAHPPITEQSATHSHHTQGMTFWAYSQSLQRACAQQSMPYMHGWSNIARSH